MGVEPCVKAERYSGMGGAYTSSLAPLFTSLIKREQALIDPSADQDLSILPTLQPPTFSLRISADPDVRVSFSYQRDDSPADCSVSGPHLTRGAQALLPARLDDALREARDERALASAASSSFVTPVSNLVVALPLFNVSERMRQIVLDDPEICDALAGCRPRAEPPPAPAAPQRPSTITIKRLLFWSHHLKATSKRKDIVQWGSELELWGISKPGYPGVFFVEGVATDVDEFASRIKVCPPARVPEELS